MLLYKWEPCCDFLLQVTFAFVCQEALKAFYFALLQASKLLAPKVSTWSTPLVATKVRVELLVAAAAKRQPATPQEALIAQCSLALAREMADKLATATLQTTGRMVEDSQSVACQMLLSCVLGACESQGLVRTLERYTTQSSTPVGSPSKAAASGQVPTPHGSPSAAQQGSSSPAGEGAVPAAAPGTAPTAAAPATGVTAPAVTPAGAASEVAASPEAYAALLQVLGVAAAAAAAGLVASTSQAQLPANTSLSAGGVMGGSTMWPMPLMQGSLPIAPLPVSLPVSTYADTCHAHACPCASPKQQSSPGQHSSCAELAPEPHTETHTRTHGAHAISRRVSRCEGYMLLSTSSVCLALTLTQREIAELCLCESLFMRACVRAGSCAEGLG